MIGARRDNRLPPPGLLPRRRRPTLASKMIGHMPRQADFPLTFYNGPPPPKPVDVSLTAI